MSEIIEFPEWLDDKVLTALSKKGFDIMLLHTMPVPTMKIWRRKTR